LPGAEQAATARPTAIAEMERQRVSRRFPEVFAYKAVVSPQKRIGEFV